MEKLEACTLLVGIWTGAVAVENIVVSQKLKTELAHDPAILLGIHPKKLKARSQRDTSMFVAALFQWLKGGSNPRVD